MSDKYHRMHLETALSYNMFGPVAAVKGSMNAWNLPIICFHTMLNATV